VKSWNKEYPELACNEFVCLSMAKEAGLTVSPFYLSENSRLLISIPVTNQNAYVDSPVSTIE
jgi:serine/threonine-protein kinase HipA